MWKEAQLDIHRLNEEREPRPCISMGDDNSYIAEHIKHVGREGTLVRVLVENLSPTLSVEGACCVVREVVGRSHAHVNTPLEPLSGHARFDLDPGGKKFVNIIFVPKTGKEMFVCYEDQQAAGNIPLGDQKLRLMVQGKNVSPYESTFSITFDGSSKVSESGLVPIHTKLRARLEI